MKIRQYVCAALLLCFGCSTLANELPESPKPKTDAPVPVVEAEFVQSKSARRERTVTRSFLTVYGALGLAWAADLKTTTNIKPPNYETNPILGRHPSNSTLVAFGAGYFAAEVGLGYFLKHYGQHHRWARYLWLIEPTFATLDHAHAAYHNETAN
jgi:hypothetical protein